MAWAPRRDIALPDIPQFVKLNGLGLSDAKKALKDALSECPYDWDEISAWLKKGKRSERSGHPPDYPSWVCPFCTNQMRWVYWENDAPPEWLCGRGGWVEICESCEWWGRYHWVWMS